MAGIWSSGPWYREYSSIISNNRNVSFSNLMAGYFVVWSSSSPESSTCNCFASVDSVEMLAWFFKIYCLAFCLHFGSAGSKRPEHILICQFRLQPLKFFCSTGCFHCRNEFLRSWKFFSSKRMVLHLNFIGVQPSSFETFDNRFSLDIIPCLPMRWSSTSWQISLVACTVWSIHFTTNMTQQPFLVTALSTCDYAAIKWPCLRCCFFLVKSQCLCWKIYLVN